MAVSNQLTFGHSHAVIKDKRVGAVQTVSGTGALRTAGEFIAMFRGDGTPLYLPTPTWGNHGAIFRRSRLDVRSYRYYDPSTISLDFEGMCQDLSAVPEGSVVLLQACAMNPTGVDPTPEQWRELSAILKPKNVFVLFDNAYQGFASGDADADAFSVRHVRVRLERMFETNRVVAHRHCVRAVCQRRPRSHCVSVLLEELWPLRPARRLLRHCTSRRRNCCCCNAQRLLLLVTGPLYIYFCVCTGGFR